MSDQTNLSPTALSPTALPGLEGSVSQDSPPAGLDLFPVTLNILPLTRDTSPPITADVTPQQDMPSLEMVPPHNHVGTRHTNEPFYTLDTRLRAVARVLAIGAVRAVQAAPIEAQSAISISDPMLHQRAPGGIETAD